jgi:hypothetical protein
MTAAAGRTHEALIRNVKSDFLLQVTFIAILRVSAAGTSAPSGGNDAAAVTAAVPTNKE